MDLDPPLIPQCPIVAPHQPYQALLHLGSGVVAPTPQNLGTILTLIPIPSTITTLPFSEGPRSVPPSQIPSSTTRFGLPMSLTMAGALPLHRPRNVPNVLLPRSKFSISKTPHDAVISLKSNLLRLSGQPPFSTPGSTTSFSSYRTMSGSSSAGHQEGHPSAGAGSFPEFRYDPHSHICPLC